jgi:MFS family permease
MKNDKKVSLDKGSTTFLRLVIYAIGLFVIGLCIVALPLGLASDQTGYYKPILAGLYVPAIPFFYALHQALRLLSNIDANRAFSVGSIAALRNIRNCGLAISGLFALGSPYIFYAADRDDAPGVLLVALIIVFASFVIAVFAAVLQKLIQNALDIKTENDLTV